MDTEKTGVIAFDKCTVNTTSTPEITKKMNSYTIVLRFADQKNEQVSAAIRDLLIKSYTEKLFSQNA